MRNKIRFPLRSSHMHCKPTCHLSLLNNLKRMYCFTVKDSLRREPDWLNSLFRQTVELTTTMMMYSIDNRILKFLDLVLMAISTDRNVTNFTERKKWQTLRKTGCYWAEEYATLQLHRSSHAEVK